MILDRRYGLFPNKTIRHTTSNDTPGLAMTHTPSLKRETVALICRGKFPGKTCMRFIFLKSSFQTLLLYCIVVDFQFCQPRRPMDHPLRFQPFLSVHTCAYFTASVSLLLQCLHLKAVPPIQIYLCHAIAHAFAQRCKKELVSEDWKMRPSRCQFMCVMFVCLFVG